MTWEQLGLKNPYAKPEAAKPQQQEEKQEVKVQVPGLVHAEGRLTEENLRICWNTYANNLPRLQNAMAQRMKGIRPVLLSDTSFEITVNNHDTGENLKSMFPDLKRYICQAVGIEELDIRIQETKVEETHYMTKSEILQAMIAKNPHIKQLMDTLHLQINY